VNFFAFSSTDSNSASNFAFYDTHKEFLPKHFLLLLALRAYFKAKHG
jgi:hypothetical protein